MSKQMLRLWCLSFLSAAILIVGSLALPNVDAATNYNLNNLSPNYIVHWIGNTFAARKTVSSKNLRHVAQSVDDLYVAADGTCYTNSVWDERFAQASAYKNGVQTVIMEKMLGWGKKGGHAVTAERKFVYVGATVRNIGLTKKNKFDNPVFPEQDDTWYGFRVYDAKTGKIKPFSQGYGVGSGFVAVNVNGNHIEGMAIRDRLLYISDTANNILKAYDLDDLSQKPAYSWQIDRPGKLAFDRNGYLWIAQYLTNNIICFDLNQNQIVRTISLPNDSVAYDLAIDNQNRLLVTDLGKEQNIKVWADIDSTPRLLNSIGSEGGIFAENEGRFAPLKFYNPKGVDTDAAGNLYVAQDAWASEKGGGAIIESYSSNLKLNWQVLSLEFMSTLDVDRENNFLYSKERRYTFDFSKKPGESFNYHSTTLNPERFPDDPRLHVHFTDVQLRTVFGKKMLFMVDNNGKSFAAYRIQSEADSQIIVPYALFLSPTRRNWHELQPKANEWIWIDRNLDGQFDAAEFDSNPDRQKRTIDFPSNWFVETGGNLWVPAKDSIYKFSVLESETGYPVWNFQNTTEFNAPAPFKDVRRVIYEPETETMYVSGFMIDSSKQERKPIGSELARFEQWNNAPSLKWIINTPWDRSKSYKRHNPIALDVAGKYIFVGVGNTGKSKDIEKQSTVYVYAKDNADYIGSMYHDNQVGPIMLDKIQGLNAVENDDGSYFVFLEDAAFARSIMLHWQPVENITNR